MRKASLAIPLLMLVILTGCFRSTPIYDLNPSGDYTTRWLHGCEYVILQNNDIITSLGYVNSEGNMLVFHLEVINRSSDDILVAPETFYYRPLEAGSLDETMNVKAADPEVQLMKIDKLLAHKKADQSNQALTDFLVESADLIGDISEAGERTVEEEQLDSQEDLERHIEQQQRKTRTSDQINDLSQQRNRWSNIALRKTTLKQNEVIQGEIYFPTDKAIEQIQVILGIGGNNFEVVFDQTRF